ncbi:MAG: hypothetical protein BEU04_00775 [Marine Group III euryarchaeote CG-Bathy1]|uniref:DNA primase small subunit PriS n=1 Tax=Marine Group III euryarchaeote CG-Bathy1 TaxID=1889001 RepID=A0A1J5THE1_9ARCH|nr:MAG: hypothetical protein BEU04_00775 [Marine Group III euryarchaeote CG-Bathy1]
MSLVGEKERAHLEITKTQNFLKEKFRNYYSSVKLKTPPRFTSREWGFLGWSGKLMNRHQSFRSKKDLQSYLSKYGPKHAYHSVAYYSIPNAPTMKDKSWQGADLIFDLDADHIPNAKQVLSSDPDGFQKLMKTIQDQTYRLVNDFLLGDMAFDIKDLMITFSGGRGYHVHIRDASVLNLSSSARRDIVDYVTGQGLIRTNLLKDSSHMANLKSKGIEYSKKITISNFSLYDQNAPGWQGHISRHINDFLNNLSTLDRKSQINNLVAINGITPSMANKIKISDNSSLTFRNMSRKNGELSKAQSSLVNMAVQQQSVFPDEPVTGDTHRLIRLPNSLHGGSGMSVVELDLETLKTFIPLEEATVFGDSMINIKALRSSKIKMGKVYNLKEGEVTSVPEKVGIYFMCRGLASLTLKT